VVARCLAKEPERRWQSARDVALELEDLAKEGVPAAPTSRAAIAPPAKSRPLRSRRAVIVASLLLLAATAAWLALREKPAPIAAASSTVADSHSPAASTGRPMIVVLPFENLGPPEQNYFAAGMSEAITSRLARIAELGVISRSSALQYAGRAKSVRQMGEELGVDWVLEGTVLWAGDRVRITQQLTSRPRSRNR
jgi:TolB-like protein